MELISNNGYGLHFMKSSGALAAETIVIDRQQELKPLPSGLRYAFLNDNTETPVIINDKLSDEEIEKLIAVLEKHRAVFGYSLQDLKGNQPYPLHASYSDRSFKSTFQRA